MTNPGNAAGTNAAFGGRTSVNAFNDVLAAFSGRGVLSGWGCVPSAGLTVAMGGNGVVRDVAIAEDNAGNRTTINNISAAPIEITLEEAPEAGARIDLIVAYVQNPATSTNDTADNPTAVGLIPVTGAVSNSPVAPDEEAVRVAITADGGSGSTAYYVVLASVTVGAEVTDITADAIEAGAPTGAAAVENLESYSIPVLDWEELASSTPYKFAAIVTATHPISATTVVELINDQAVLFGNYGFAVGAVSGQNVVIYATKAPSAAVTLKINYKEAV